MRQLLSGGALCLAVALATGATPFPVAAQASGASASDAVSNVADALSLRVGERTSTATRAALLADTRMQEIVVDDDNYKRPMRMHAIPFADWLTAMMPDAAKAAAQGATATVVATDGYVSHIPLTLLLGHLPRQPQAYLAVAPENAPWPPLKGDAIGPFRLVWRTPPGPARGGVNESHWTYSIGRIEITPSPRERFPVLRPAANTPPGSAIMRGAAVFERACFSCHSLNGAGDAHLGPDLNTPSSPVEYLGERRLAALIRNPQSLRWWPNSRMPAIDRATVSDTELTDLLAYLHHMSGRKAPPPNAK
ncbi:cytochrome C [Pandoraea terrae]|uniref:Cytochrome C n=1 Tax=Pandoraea terrae TaxID=1537710 RepID=A0A5E4VYV7_9BURK|nr:cytochrome c [Pandoraea terrae]VVE17817.1 cytochrome C [Pandoraea terrae]